MGSPAFKTNVSLLMKQTFIKFLILLFFPILVFINYKGQVGQPWLVGESTYLLPSGLCAVGEAQ